MVAHSVIPDWTSFFTTVMTCTEPELELQVQATWHAGQERQQLLIKGLTSLDVYESRPAVGSSMNSTQGLVMSAMPMLVRLHCTQSEC
jgi:hypothetical protein